MVVSRFLSVILRALCCSAIAQPMMAQSAWRNTLDTDCSCAAILGFGFALQALLSIAAGTGEGQRTLHLLICNVGNTAVSMSTLTCTGRLA